MIRPENYFDHAATSPLDPGVFEAMIPWFHDNYGNAHSLHSLGVLARDAVEKARIEVADAIAADDPGQIVFTSGATEGNNWVVKSATSLAIGPFEHASVEEVAQVEGARLLRNDGWSVPSQPVGEEMVSLMAVNNEVGSLYLDSQFTGQTYRHCDLTQAVGKVQFSLESIDYGTFSAHKFYGPKGIGALYSRDLPPAAYQRGGQQEMGWRAGTLNVPSIVGLSHALRLAVDRQDLDFHHVEKLRSVLLTELESLSDVQILGGNAASPFILAIAFYGVQGEAVVIDMDRLGFALSSGAACSSGTHELSHVLVRAQLDEHWARGMIRLSFGRANTMESSRECGIRLKEVVNRLRSGPNG